jgi:hypothetical protein
MEESRRFRQTYIKTEHFAGVGGDAVQFDIDGIYVPDTTVEAAPKTGTVKRSAP